MERLDHSGETLRYVLEFDVPEPLRSTLGGEHFEGWSEWERQEYERAYRDVLNDLAQLARLAVSLIEDATADPMNMKRYDAAIGRGIPTWIAAKVERASTRAAHITDHVKHRQFLSEED